MIEELLAGMTPGKAVLWSLGIFTLFCIFRKLQASAQIARLGARAPKIHFRLPYGMLLSSLSSRTRLTVTHSTRLHLCGPESELGQQGYRILG